MRLSNLKKEIKDLSNPKQAKIYARFFKTGLGEYGEGDQFLGIKVPVLRQVAKKYSDLKLSKIKNLLKSPVHEHRFVALVILTHQFKKGSVDKRKKIFEFYLKNTQGINNWDLVDASCYKIVGEYLIDKPKKRKVLYKLAKSKNLWERRIAIISTMAFIKNSQFEDTLNLSKILLDDEHDLIHKAVGWMLREVGKRDQETEERFLKKHCQTMPRTMLRYAIEKFSKQKRDFYLGR